MADALHCGSQSRSMTDFACRYSRRLRQLAIHWPMAEAEAARRPIAVPIDKRHGHRPDGVPAARRDRARRGRHDAACSPVWRMISSTPIGVWPRASATRRDPCLRVGGASSGGASAGLAGRSGAGRRHRRDCGEHVARFGDEDRPVLEQPVGACRARVERRAGYCEHQPPHLGGEPCADQRAGTVRRLRSPRRARDRRSDGCAAENPWRGVPSRTAFPRSGAPPRREIASQSATFSGG